MSPARVQVRPRKRRAWLDNERGRRIHVEVERLSSLPEAPEVEGVRFALVGPDSTGEQIVTRKEALVLTYMLAAALGLKIEPSGPRR